MCALRTHTNILLRISVVVVVVVVVVGGGAMAELDTRGRGGRVKQNKSFVC